jgi:hypothetical protein
MPLSGLKRQFCGLRAAKSGGLSLAVASMEVLPEASTIYHVRGSCPLPDLDLKQAEQIVS